MPQRAEIAWDDHNHCYSINESEKYKCNIKNLGLEVLVKESTYADSISFNVIYLPNSLRQGLKATQTETRIKLEEH